MSYAPIGCFTTTLRMLGIAEGTTSEKRTVGLDHGEQGICAGILTAICTDGLFGCICGSGEPCGKNTCDFLSRTYQTTAEVSLTQAKLTTDQDE